ncbi:MAG: hypothetical protein A2046_09890 [Bacteroidetes bacterium GWA2_30_7]|nr:MAG: hypothetical protein A2046_09890 [Bacteroidetes bacterium GWA2_30_7]
MKFQIILIIFITALFLSSCKKDNLKDNKYYTLTPFNRIELNSTFDVYLNEDSNYSINIVGDKNIIENITFYIEDNILKISNKQKLKWLTPTKNKVELYINSKPLRMIVAKQTCNINTLSAITSDVIGLVLSSKANQANLELNCNEFYYWNDFPCGGKLTLYGKTEKIKLWNFAIMSIDAKNLITNYALVENSSKGNCEVTVLKEFEYSIFGTGDIILNGSPPKIIENQLKSSGALIKH